MVKMMTSSAEVVVECVEPQRAICPGQIAAFYSGEECLGSAVIAGNDHLGQRGAFSRPPSWSLGGEQRASK